MKQMLATRELFQDEFWLAAREQMMRLKKECDNSSKNGRKIVAT
jgi:hypothetical protein